jgi:hypothetical protein
MTSNALLSILALGTLIAFGCSSNSADDNNAAGGGASGTTGGGSATLTGGTNASAGSSTGGAGTAGNTGTTGGASACAMASISNGGPCTADCVGNTCGIHRVGLRDCPCVSSVYACTTCTYANVTDAVALSIITAPTSALPVCDSADSVMEDRTDCGTTVADGYRCQSQGDARRMCACYLGSAMSAKWDCGSVPSSWP